MPSLSASQRRWYGWVLFCFLTHPPFGHPLPTGKEGVGYPSGITVLIPCLQFENFKSPLRLALPIHREGMGGSFFGRLPAQRHVCGEGHLQGGCWGEEGGEIVDFLTHPALWAIQKDPPPLRAPLPTSREGLGIRTALLFKYPHLQSEPVKSPRGLALPIHREGIGGFIFLFFLTHPALWAPPPYR